MKIITTALLTIILWEGYTQEILPLPAGMQALDESKIDLALNNLHNYLEYVHGANKLATINTSGYTESIENWPNGSWGNGYFTPVEIKNYLGSDNSGSYTSWYEGDPKYNSCRPMVRDAARVITAYINLHGTGVIDDSIIIQRITDGINFLLTEQLLAKNENNNIIGPFMYWASRPNSTTPNSGDSDIFNLGARSLIELYDSSIAIDALTKAYYFYKKHNISTIPINTIYSSIDNAGNWFSHMTSNFVTYNEYGCQDGSYERTTNVMAFGIWGLINAYKVTRKIEYLNLAINNYEKSINSHLLANGAWTYYNCRGTQQFYSYHDTQGHYTGIILKILIELYNQVPCTYVSNLPSIGNSKDNLKVKIISTINHFLAEGMADETAINRVRLQPNGEIADYVEYEGTNDISLEIELFDALDYLLSSDLYKEFSTIDKARIDTIYRALAKPRLDNLINDEISQPFLAFRSLSYFKRRKFYELNNTIVDQAVLYSSLGDSANDNKIGIYNTYNEEHLGYANNSGVFDIMTTGDFDKDGEDDIAFYRKSDGRISIFKSGYNSYTGCNPVYIGSIETGFKLFDLMESIDYDNDGYQDEIVMYNKYYSGNYNRIDILDIDGLYLSKYSNSGSVFDLMTTGDFDDDGKDELALYRKTDGRISIYNPEYASSGGYTGNSPVYAGSIETGFKLHDNMETVNYDNEGRDEIVMHNKFYSGKTNRIDILDMNGHLSSLYSNAGGVFDLMATGDFDLDGKDEIAFYRKNDGRISIYNPEHAENANGYTGYEPVYTGSIETNILNYNSFSVLKRSTKDYLAKGQLSKSNTLIKSISITEHNDNQLLFYPNPVSNELNISFEVKDESDIEIYFTSLFGTKIKVLNVYNINAGTHEILYKKNSLKGMYILHLKVNGRIVGIKKVIFQ
ncbi:T9SS type A sorting domain-containing protein [Aquimarina algiphila]|uniref:T9SS type A sorting domain-containing protein n=1 Tax=Aquimarina algiphila TaxID=2047982 RepID=UPI002491DA74|nr:T9SS type A sorting domain-containing protein [Aquimarina algiphila]